MVSSSSQMHFSSERNAIMLSEEHLKHLQQMEENLSALEEERRKVDAFKRELPLCMQLLNNAIQFSKTQLAEYQVNSSAALSLRLGCDYGAEIDLTPQSTSENRSLKESVSSPHELAKEEREEPAAGRSIGKLDDDKPSWMSTQSLWTDQAKSSDIRQEVFKATENRTQLDSWALESKQTHTPASKFVSNSSQGSGGAFSPFVRERQSAYVSAEKSILAKETLPSETNNMTSPVRTVLKLSEDGSEVAADTQCKESKTKHTTRDVGRAGDWLGGGINVMYGNDQNQRKPRRCWSPELHRLFVAALEQLGGAYVATPKQIREHMKIEGLTNDEVKSHLQKYRLHIKRPSPPPQTPPSASSHLLVPGVVWKSQDQCSAAVQKNLCVPIQHQISAEDCRLYLESSTMERLGHRILYEQHGAIYERTSSSKQNQSTGELSQGPEGSSEGYAEESLGDDAKSDSCHHNLSQECFINNRTCRSSDLEMATQEQYEEDDDGDVTEAEDSRGSEKTEGDRGQVHGI